MLATVGLAVRRAPPPILVLTLMPVRCEWITFAPACKSDLAPSYFADGDFIMLRFSTRLEDLPLFAPCAAACSLALVGRFDEGWL